MKRLTDFAARLLMFLGMFGVVAGPVMVLVAIWEPSWQWLATAVVDEVLGCALFWLGNDL